MLEDNRRKIEESQRRAAEEQARKEEERYRELENLQRHKEEQMRRKKKEEEQSRNEQMKILGKKNTRPKLSFALGSKWCGVVAAASEWALQFPWLLSAWYALHFNDDSWITITVCDHLLWYDLQPSGFRLLMNFDGKLV